MDNPLTDAQLVAAALSGSLSAFEALVVRHQHSLYVQAMSYMHVKEEAQDAVQDACLQAFDRLETLKEHSRFSPWIGRILRHICLNRLRARRRYLTLSDSAGEMEDLRDRSEQSIFQNAALTELLSRLPTQSARAFALHYLEGYSIREVALQMQTTPSAVKQRLYRAREKLQEEIVSMAKDDRSKLDLPDGFAAQTIARLLEEGARDRLYMRMEDARTRFREALEVAPDHPEALKELGRTYDPIQGPTEEEVATLRRAARVAPDSIEVASALTVALADDSDRQAAAIEKCLELCRLRLEKDPEDCTALVIRAQMLMWQLDFAQMEATARRAVALAPKNQQCLNYLALSLARQDRWDEAYPLYETICELDDKTVWAYFALRQMGSCLAFHRGDWKSAVGFPEKVWNLTQRPNEAGNLIFFYGQAGMVEKAKALFAKVKDHPHPERVYKIVGKAKS